MSALTTSFNTECGAGLTGSDRSKKSGESRFEGKTDVSAYLHDPLGRESKLPGPKNESHELTGFKSNIQNQLSFISNSEIGIEINTMYNNI